MADLHDNPMHGTEGHQVGSQVAQAKGLVGMREMKRRLRVLEHRRRVSRGESLPIAILHSSMIDALGFTPDERRRLVRSPTKAELEEWASRRKD